MSQDNDLIQLESFTWEQLVSFVNELVANDFNRLIQVLYRLDISEKKLKQTLADHPEKDAGELIARLIIERQAEKKKSREQFKQGNHDIPEDERW